MINTIIKKLAAGFRVLVYEDADEKLAVRNAAAAAATIAQVTISEPNDEAINWILDPQPGVYVIPDLLRIMGDNARFIRAIRAVALGPTTQRLIMIETPGVMVPSTLLGDIGRVVCTLPDINALTLELGNFRKQFDVSENGDYALASAVTGIGRHEAARLFAECYVSNNKKLDAEWLRRAKASMISQRFAGALRFINVENCDMGGYQVLKSWLASRKVAYGNSTAIEYGLPSPRGIALLGPPGTGKSLCARYTASVLGVPLLRLDAGALYGGLVGQTEAQLRAALNAAEACAPCILLIDEVDKALASGGLDGGTSQRFVGELQTWLQDSIAPIFKIVTCNKLPGTGGGDSTASAMLRKGRFDELFFVDFPAISEREDILRIKLLERKRDPDKFNISLLAQRTSDWSGAELEAAILDAMYTAFADNREVVTTDIELAVSKTVPYSKTNRDQVQTLRKWAFGRTVNASIVPPNEER